MLQRWTLLACSLWSLSSWASLPAHVQRSVGLLESAYETLEEIKSELPFSFVEGNFKRRALEGRFTRANRAVFSGTDLILEKPKRAIQRFAESLEEFEKIAFLLPFHQMEEAAFITVFDKYQKALGEIREARKLLLENL